MRDISERALGEKSKNQKRDELDPRTSEQGDDTGSKKGKQTAKGGGLTMSATRNSAVVMQLAFLKKRRFRSERRRKD